MKKVIDMYKAVRDVAANSLDIAATTIEMASSEMTTYELAAELGYEKFLAKMEYELNEREASYRFNNTEVREITLVFPIEYDEENKTMTFNSTNFEEQEIKIAEAIALLRKQGYIARLGYNQGENYYEFQVSKKGKLPEQRIQDAIQMGADFTEKAADKVTGTVDSVKEKAGNSIKKTLRNLSDLADRHL